MSFLIVSVLFFCSHACSNKKESNVQWSMLPDKQDSLFLNLIAVTDARIPEFSHIDSLAFLILPLQASCPSCRKKTIDRIIKYGEHLPTNHFIILSVNGGNKMINSYFQEAGAEMPVIANKLFLDSTNNAYKFALVKDNPTMYYTYDKKVYKKVVSIPATIRKDLNQFFSGHVDLK